MRWYSFLRYQAVPPLFLVVFTSAVQVLALWGQNRPLILLNFGTSFTHWLVAIYTFWALLWLWCSTKTANGPPDPQGYVPVYKDNGLAYYLGSLFCLTCVEILWPGFCTKVYQSTPELLGSLNILALVLCTYLYAISPPLQLPRAYIFYSGGQLHPRILGVDVKQFTNSRMGMMSWQLLVAINWYHGLCLHGFDSASFANFAVQTGYIFKFFAKECWYWYSLDMSLDNAGYYMCWGCLVWLPCLWPISSRLLATAPLSTSLPLSVVSLLLGLASVLLLHTADAQKRLFRQDPQALLWGYRPDSLGPFLTSGFWRLARHPNYTLDFLSAFFSSLPALPLGHAPFLVVYFLFCLFVHRVFRDEEKCSKKYGPLYDEYCKKVPYRLVPYIF